MRPNRWDPSTSRVKPSRSRCFTSRALGRRSTGHGEFNSPLVGRQAELLALQERITQLRAGKGGLVTICGEAGIGKSRLVAEVRRHIQALNMPAFPALDCVPRWVEGRCVSSQTALPYALWIDILRTVLSVPQEAPPQETASGVRAWLQENARDRHEELFPPLARLFGPAIELDGQQEPRDAEAQRRLLYEAVGTVLTRAASREPLIVVCEDLHWADPSSLELWAHLLPLIAEAPLLLVGTFRSEAGQVAQRLLGLAAAVSNASMLDLQPLSAEQCERLVRNLVGTDGLPQKLVYRILAQAEGNPFYVEEILRALIDGGVLARASTAEPWHVTREVDEIAIPDTVLGVLTARIDRLQRETRHVLQLASVVGRIFAHPVLAALAENIQDLEHHLAVLQQEELIRVRAGAAEREYIFKHELTREAAYNGILKRQRRVFHRQAAEALERLFPQQQGELLGVLAYHWEHTDEPARAIGYLLRSGDLARLAYARQEAVDAYERALALLKEQGDDEGTARTLLRLGMVHAAAFDFGKASKAYEQGFVFWSRCPSASQQADDLPPSSHPYRLLWGLEPKNWDPNPTFDYEIPLFSGLLEESCDLEAVPDVACSWELLDGGRTYLFHLRDDVRWSDDRPVTAGDFEFAWKRLLDPAVPPMNARRRALDPSTGMRSADLLHDLRGARAYHLGEISDPEAIGVRAVDPLTLLVELEQPAVYFLHVMAHPVAFPVPRHCVEQCGDAWCEAGTIVGNGPFVLKRWHPRERVDLARSPLYHGRFGGNVREVELLCLPYPTDWQARLELYESGLLDVLMISNWPRQGIELARRRHPDEYRSLPSLHTTAICINVRRPPFDDVRVRQAFAHAVDRRSLLADAQGDSVELATGGFVPSAMAGHSPQISLAYDPERARRLLAEAGYPGGRGFPEVEYRAFMTPNVTAAAARWTRNLQEVLDVSVRWTIVDWNEYYQGFDRQPPHIGFITWSANTPDPDDFLRVAYRHIQRYFGWGHDLYEQLVEGAKQVTDPEARLRLYRQADAILVREAAIVPFIHNPTVCLIKPWVKRYPLSPLAGVSAWTSLKDVVLAPH